MPNIVDFLKKIAAIFMSFIFMLTGGNAEKVDVQVVGNPTDQSTEITYQVTNYTGRTLVANKYFSIEKQTDDGWESIPFSEDFATPDIAILLKNCQSTQLTIRLQDAYGGCLPAGKYRLVLDYSPVVCEFNIAQNNSTT